VIPLGTARLKANRTTKPFAVISLFIRHLQQASNEFVFAAESLVIDLVFVVWYSYG
jgi:hypothetical protein